MEKAGPGVTRQGTDALNRQRALHRSCYHPSGTCARITEAEINGSLPDRFERQVEAYADRPAYIGEKVSLTYRELNGRANRIAHRLLAAGLSAGEPVLALLDEGADRIAAFLGILKAGGCHIALGPGLPRERQQFLVHQSGTRVLLTHNRHRKLGEGLAGEISTVITLDDAADASPRNPGIAIRADQPCWIVYTSGSTGEPKGVVQTHRNVLHDLRTYVDGFQISPEDRMSLLMSLTTSAGCFCALMALGNGAALCRIDVQNRGVEHMAGAVAGRQLTIWGGVPSLFRQWMANPLPDYPDLRLVWFGGEAVHARDFELYRSRLSPNCLFVNRLGSTETQCTRMFFAGHATRITGSTVPVGYPVAGQEILLRNEDGQAVEAPGSGEIVVRGAYLSTGYWKRPDLTEAAFTTLDAASGLREYRTGDLGEMDADGCLTYFGRKDFQVQIRGYRVEVAEIETVLDRLPTLREAVAMGEPLAEGGHELVAYVVPAQSPGPGVTELREELARQVPEYMIPARFIYLEALPRAANGKIIRSHLREAAPLPVPCDSRIRLPETPVQRLLAGLWDEVLERDENAAAPIGLDDNFFALGGHSLKGTKLLARLRQHLSVELTLRTLFDHPTLTGLAEEVERLKAGD